MASTSSTIYIDSSQERVMGIISDVENYPKWTSGISGIEILERNNDGKPTKAVFSISGGPISDRVELAYDWQPNSVSWHLIKGDAIKSLVGTYRVEKNGNGCDVTYELSAEVTMPIPNFIKAAGEKTIVQNALQGLKDFANV